MAYSAVGTALTKPTIALLSKIPGFRWLSNAKTLESVADDVLESGKTSGAVSELRVGSKTFYGHSGESVTQNNNVIGVLAGNRGARSAYDGACAEMVCLHKAFNAGVNPAGGTMRTLNVGNRYNPHGSTKTACETCSDALNYLGVDY